MPTASGLISNFVFVKISYSFFLTDLLLATAALNTRQLHGRSLLEVLVVTWPAQILPLTTKTLVPGLSIAMSTLLWFLVFNLHRLAKLMDRLVMVILMEETGNLKTYLLGGMVSKYRKKGTVRCGY